MPQYLIAGYLPDDFDPSQADEAMGREIHALNEEMIAAGVRKFACGLGAAKSLRAQADGGDETLGVVDFSIFPHLDHPMLPENTMADAERWAAGLGLPAYAIDDETAILVAEGRVEVVSEGHWKRISRE